MAHAFDVNGAAKVFVIGRREDAVKRTASEAKNGTIIPVVGDVTSKDSLQKCVDFVKTHVDHVDVVVANAGTGGPRTVTKNADGSALSFEELHANLWAPEMQDVTAAHHLNITSVAYTTFAFLPLLHAANKLREYPSNKPRPQVIATSSVGAYNRVPLGNMSYGPSKLAVIQMMKQFSTVFVPYDIRANVIAPGYYLSDLTQAGFDKMGILDTHNVEGTWPRQEIPLTRSGDAEDIAGVILFLCSRAGAYTNGCVLTTDGGRLAMTPASY